MLKDRIITADSVILQGAKSEELLSSECQLRLFVWKYFCFGNRFCCCSDTAFITIKNVVLL